VIYVILHLPLYLFPNTASHDNPFSKRVGLVLCSNVPYQVEIFVLLATSLLLRPSSDAAFAGVAVHGV
jgi:hypothetical protein